MNVCDQDYLRFDHIVENIREETGWKSESRLCGEAVERWVQDNLYCPHCFKQNVKTRKKPKRTLEKLGYCTKSVDFVCKVCGNGIQVKSKKGSFYTKRGKVKQITAGEYYTTLNNLFENPPYFILIEYVNGYRVSSISYIDKRDVSDDCVNKRNPLTPQSRRPGWTGGCFQFPGEIVKNFCKPIQLKFSFMQERRDNDNKTPF